MIRFRYVRRFNDQNKTVYTVLQYAEDKDTPSSNAQWIDIPSEEDAIWDSEVDEIRFKNWLGNNPPISIRYGLY